MRILKTTLVALLFAPIMAKAAYDCRNYDQTSVLFIQHRMPIQVSLQSKRLSEMVAPRGTSVERWILATERALHRTTSGLEFQLVPEMGAGPSITLAFTMIPPRDASPFIVGEARGKLSDGTPVAFRLDCQIVPDRE